MTDVRIDTDDQPRSATAPEAVPTPGPVGRVALRVRADRRFAVRLGSVAALAAVWRLGWVLAHRSSGPSPDGFAYHAIAKSFAAGDGFVNPLVPGAPTALHPPGWSALLALPPALGVESWFGQQVLAAVVGTVTVVLVGLLGRRLGGDRVGVLAALVAAVHPELWGWERELASETLLLPLAVLAILQAYRVQRRPGWAPAAVLGLLIGLLVLTRTEQALLLPFLAAPVLLLGRSDRWTRRLAELALAGAVALLVSVPWIAYNHDRFQEPVFLTTGAGVTLRYANSPTTYDGPLLGYGDPAAWTELPPGGPADRDESTDDLAYRTDAIDFIRGDLGRLPVVVAAREGRTWGLFRADQQATLDQAWGGSPRWIHVAGLWTYRLSLPLAALGAYVLRRRGISLVPLVAPIGVVVLYVAVTYGQTRYRVTADLTFVVLAAVGIDALARRALRRGPRPVIDLTDGPHDAPPSRRRPLPTPRARPAPRTG